MESKPSLAGSPHHTIISQELGPNCFGDWWVKKRHIFKTELPMNFQSLHRDCFVVFCFSGFLVLNDYVVYYITWMTIHAQTGICPSFDVPKDSAILRIYSFGSKSSRRAPETSPIHCCLKNHNCLWFKHTKASFSVSLYVRTSYFACCILVLIASKENTDSLVKYMASYYQKYLEGL